MCTWIDRLDFIYNQAFIRNFLKFVQTIEFSNGYQIYQMAFIPMESVSYESRDISRCTNAAETKFYIEMMFFRMTK